MPVNKESIPDEKYFEILRNIFQMHIEISDKEWKIIEEKLKLVKVPKNTVVFKSKEIETVARFVIRGVVKTTYEGEETYIENFLTDSDFICDVYSFSEGIPSMYSIETITDCVWVETLDLKNLLEDSPKLQAVFLRYISRYLQKSYDYNKQIRKQTAKEQYIHFCKIHPKIVKYAKVTDIASYFGITVQSLSRIRNEIVSKGS